MGEGLAGGEAAGAVGRRRATRQNAGARQKTTGPGGAGARQGAGAGAKEPTLEEALAGLAREEAGTLAGLIGEWAQVNEQLREQVLLHAAWRAGPEVGAKVAKRAFGRAVRVRGYVDYRKARGWAREVDAAIDAIEMLGQGGPAQAIGVCEWALGALCRAIESVDDSDGHFQMLRDRLEGVHLRACEAARPEPVELARRLFRMELESEWDVFSDSAAVYAGVLGAEGAREFRRLAEAEWAEEREGRRSQITRIMEGLARQSGDVEELVRVWGRDLSSGYQYWRIAEAYRAAGQRGRALEWGEAGLRAFAERPDERLRTLVMEEYQASGQAEAALAVAWAWFLEGLAVEGYLRLRRQAERAGVWAEWRERALAEIRRGLAARPEGARRQTGRRDHSVLVEIFLEEGLVEEAWSEARAGDCAERLWLELARVRVETHAEESAAIYWEAAERELGRNGYEGAVRLLELAAEAMQRLGRSGEFGRKVDGLVEAHKRKRNFVKRVWERAPALFLEEGGG